MNNARIASLLRRNVWWMDLGFVGVVMYFLASTCNGGLAWAIGRVPTVDDVAVAPLQTARAPGLHRRQALNQLADRNLLALRRETLAVPESMGQPEQPKFDLNLREFQESDLQPCTVNATVRGTMVADKAQWSMAVIVRNDTREPAVLSARDGNNEIFDDARIVAIRSREVVVRRRDHFERCTGEGDPAAPAPPPPPTPMVHGDDEPQTSEVTGVTKMSGTDYRVERAEVDKALANLNEVATQARIVPSFKNGRANGFKMFAIKRASIYDKIGLQNGDVIQKINGYEMNSPERALEIYSKLSNATSLSIELSRGSVTMTLNYAIN